MTVKDLLKKVAPAERQTETASTCKECHRITCMNATIIEPEVNDDNYERNFLDIFCIVK